MAERRGSYALLIRISEDDNVPNVTTQTCQCSTTMMLPSHKHVTCIELKQSIDHITVGKLICPFSSVSTINLTARRGLGNQLNWTTLAIDSSVLPELWQQSA